MTQIQVDVANPGAVYAGLGLFALAGRQYDGLRAMFAADGICFSGCGEMASTLTRTLTRTLARIAGADLLLHRGQVIALEPRLEDSPPDAPRSTLAAWRGRGLRAWRACQRAIPNALNSGLEGAITAQVPLTDDEGRWVAPPCRDARLSRWTDLDLGFDRRRVQPMGAPVLELLAVIGLEHFPLQPHDAGGWRYVTWHHPMSYREARARFLLWRDHGDEQAFEADADTWRFRRVPEAGLRGAWGWATKEA